MNYKSIEMAAFRSWPALEEFEDNGIVRRASNGYTKRANSANVIGTQKGSFETLLKQNEAYFNAKNLPCIFRIPSFSHNQPLDDFLESKGYEAVDRTLVLYKSLEHVNVENITLAKKSSDDWIASYCDIRELDMAANLAHLEILKRIQDESIMAVLIEDGVEVACGLGVISNGYFGLFDIATKVNMRGKGYATKLIDGMLHWGVSCGATHAYLQVVADNQAAMRLYNKFGYEPCYEYWYRINSKS